MHWEHFAAVLGDPQSKTRVSLCENCGGQVFLVDEEGKLGPSQKFRSSDRSESHKQRWLHCAAACALEGRGRLRHPSCHCKTTSAASSAKTFNIQTIVSSTPGPSLSQPMTPSMKRTSRKINATEKLRVIHWRCCVIFPWRISTSATRVVMIHEDAWVSAAKLNERGMPALSWMNWVKNPMGAAISTAPT